ncbi:MAG: PHP domain-containing protein [Chloroflexi bacterium]|nr:PHP domain-containing protein [Chloroflexota bacterium]
MSLSALVDLHLHTTASDGQLSPTRLVDMLAARGLRVAAITDHDTTAGMEEALQAAHRYPALTIIPGVELSTDVPGGEIHLLGYLSNYNDPHLQDALRRFREGREVRGRRIVEKLAELGMPIEWERVRELAGDGAVGRPHVARAMVEKGYVSQIPEAFTKYIGRDGPAYVERLKLTPEEAVRLVVETGGLPVLAHPAEVAELDTVLVSLKAAGLVGMEVYYAQYPAPKRSRLAEAARRHDLLPCGGSDYHAFGTPEEAAPGDLGPPLELAEELMRRVGMRLPTRGQ